MGSAGTLNGTITKNAASLLSGDADPAMTFDGATGYASLPAAGLPSGNAAWSLECWCKPTNATNTANGYVVTIGNPGTNGAAGFIAQAASGGWLVGSWSGSGHDFGHFGSSTAGLNYDGIPGITRRYAG